MTRRPTDEGKREITAARLRGQSPRADASPPSLTPDMAATYGRIKPDIEARLAQFDKLWAGGAEQALFEELAFCLFTPQSKAFSCWAAVERLRAQGLLLAGRADVVCEEMAGVRFHRNKARYLVEARRTFAPGGRPAVRRVLSPLGTPPEIRECLVGNVTGYSYKEASHFLRNIGLGRELAILDRHILRNLVAMGVVREVPGTLPRERYLEIERCMSRFAESARIPMAHLDFLLWHKEAGAVFK